MEITESLLAELLANLASLTGRAIPQGERINALTLSNGQTIVFARKEI